MDHSTQLVFKRLCEEAVGDDNYTNNSQLPAVIAELPFTGRSLEEVKACMWMAHHILATGVHGLLLCHAECEKAARELQEVLDTLFIHLLTLSQ